MAGFAHHQIQFDMRLHPVHVDELRPTDSKFSIDEGLLRPEPKKNEIQLFALIQDDQPEICLLERSEEITGAGHPHLSREHHRSEPHIGYGRMGLGGMSNFMSAGAGALQYNDFDPTMPLLEDDQKDLEAAQELIPDFSVLHGSINSNVYIQVLRKLRLELAHSDLHKGSHAKYYARLLPQLANKLTVLPSKNPSCMDNFVDPKQYGECLDALAKDMFMGSQIVSPRDSEVYVLKDRAPYVECLRLLATELRSS